MTDILCTVTFVACIMYKSLHGHALLYLADDVQLLADSDGVFDQPTTEHVLSHEHSSFGDSLFCCCTTIWNDLPPELRHVDISFGQFRNMLKSYLCRFQSATAHRDFLIIAPQKFSYLLTIKMFLPCDAMLARYAVSHPVSVCTSVSLSQDGTIQKGPNAGSRKQHWNSSFLMPKISAKF